MGDLVDLATNDKNPQTDVDKGNINLEINALASDINLISKGFLFKGQDLFDGSFSRDMQTASANGSTLALGKVSSDALGLSNLDVLDSGNAEAAKKAITTAMEKIKAQTNNVIDFRKAIDSLNASYDANGQSALLKPATLGTTFSAIG